MHKLDKDKPQYRGYLLSSYQKLHAQEKENTSEDRINFLNLVMQVWLTGALFPLIPVFNALPSLGQQMNVPLETQETLTQLAAQFEQLKNDMETSSKRIHIAEFSSFVSLIEDKLRELNHIVEVFKSSVLPQDKEQVFESFLDRITYLCDDMTEVLPLLEELRQLREND